MGVRRCLARSLTSLAPMRTPKSANGPRSNSFRPDSPPHDNLQPGTGDSASPLTTPDLVRSGRVLPTSVKSPFKVGDNQRPERTGAGVQKPTPESSVPGDNLDRGSRRNQLRRGHGSPPVLSEVFSSLALRCALQRVQTVPAAIHSGRIPPSRPTYPRDGRLSQPPSPHRT